MGVHFPNANNCNTAVGQPDTYEGNFWHFGACDNGGIHTNNGVQNHWFCLLANGGQGTNDNGDTYHVDGIGADKAAKIAFHNLKNQLGSSSEYPDAQQGAINAAINLYGECSFEHIQTVNAWFAVGIGNESDCWPVGIVKDQESIPISLKLFPNPASNTLYLKYESSKQSRISVYSSNGEKVEHLEFVKNTNTLSIDVSDYPAGLYFVQAKTQGTQTVRKFIKR